MSEFSRRSQVVSPSLTLSLTAKANEMKSKGIDVVTFGVGEPDFNTPQYIVDAAKDALDKGYTKYTAVGGVPALRQAICDKLRKDNGVLYDKTQIVVSSGAKQSLFNVLQLLVDEGDEVIIPSPYWLTYPELVKMCLGQCVYAPTYAKDGFILSPEVLEGKITPKTKALFFNTPSNPTGAVYTKEQIEALAKVLERHPNVWIISDEIYEKLTYDGTTHHSIAECKSMYSRTFIIDGVSKSYAMTGWRIGYCAAPSAILAKKMESMQSHQTSNANTIAQYATIAALEGGDEFLSEMRRVFAKRRDYMIERLEKIPSVSAVKASGAFYVMVDVSRLFGKHYGDTLISGAKDVADCLLQSHAVVVIPCEGFGAPDFIRLSYATNLDIIEKGLDQFELFLSELT